MKFIKALVRHWFTPIPGEDKGSELGNFAENALHTLIAWFGPPADLQIPYEVVRYSRSVYSYDFLSKRHVLYIRERDQIEPMLGSIAHEMYHRVTSRRRKSGLHRAVWVNEVLACHASRKVLAQLGHQRYAETLLQDMRRAPKRASLQDLRAIQSWVPFAILRRYPPHFAQTVYLIGESLEQTVGWENMCAMVHHASWKDWLALLLPEERKQFHAMFGDVLLSR